MMHGSPAAVEEALESSHAEQELSDALGADDFVSKVAGDEPETDKELLDEFNDSLGGSSEGMLADALEEEADNGDEENVAEPVEESVEQALSEEPQGENDGFGGLEKPSVDDITAESLEEEAFDAAAHEELSIEDDIHDLHEAEPSEAQSEEVNEPSLNSGGGSWPKSSLQTKIEQELGQATGEVEEPSDMPQSEPISEPVPVAAAQEPEPALEPEPEPVPVAAAQEPEPALDPEPVPVASAQEPEPKPEPVPVAAAHEPEPAQVAKASSEGGSGSFDRKPLWEGSDVVNAADYDDQELETIMDEIEDLEKKYRESSEWEGEGLEIDSNKKKMTDLQRSIEDDINAAKVKESLEVEKPKAVEPLQMDQPSSGGLALNRPEPITPLAMDGAEDNGSLALEKPEPITPLSMEAPAKPQPKVKAVPSPTPRAVNQSLGPSEMSFSAAGTMNFNMDFNVGSKVAQLSVNGEEGLVCSMDDYKVIIREGSGFTLEMPGGATLTIPVDNPGSSQKKKVG